MDEVTLAQRCSAPRRGFELLGQRGVGAGSVANVSEGYADGHVANWSVAFVATHARLPQLSVL